MRPIGDGEMVHGGHGFLVLGRGQGADGDGSGWVMVVWSGRGVW